MHMLNITWDAIWVKTKGKADQTKGLSRISELWTWLTVQMSMEKCHTSC